MNVKGFQIWLMGLAIVFMGQLNVQSVVQAQSVHRYAISFEQAMQHQARISMEFPNID